MPSTGSISRSMRWRPRGRASSPSRQPRPRRPCARRSRHWRGARARCSNSHDPSPAEIADRRLALEVGVIQALAESLAIRLTRRDPLSRARPSPSGRGDRPGAARRSRRRHRLARANGPPQATPAGRQAGMTDRTSGRGRSGGASGAGLRQLLLRRHARHAEGGAGGHVRHLQLLQDGGRHRRRWHAAARGAGNGARPLARRSWRALCRQAGRARRLPEGRGS